MGVALGDLYSWLRACDPQMLCSTYASVRFARQIHFSRDGHAVWYVLVTNWKTITKIRLRRSRLRFFSIFEMKGMIS